MKTYNLRGNGDFALNVVGESFYQDNLQAVCDIEDQDEEADHLVEAHLVLENNNPHDANAIRVDVAGLPVGYLPRDEARKYREMYRLLKLPSDVALIVDAHIRGGFPLANDSYASYGIVLDYPTDQSGAAQLREIAKNYKPKGCLASLISFPFDLITALIKTAQSLWKSRNGKIIVVASIAALIIFCCILPYALPVE